MLPQNFPLAQFLPIINPLFTRLTASRLLELAKSDSINKVKANSKKLIFPTVLSLKINQKIMLMSVIV